MNTKQQFALAVGADQSPPLFNHGKGISFEGIGAMKLDISKMDTAAINALVDELNADWAARVRAKFDSNISALREATRDFAGFKKGFNENDRQWFYLHLLNPKSPLNTAVLDSILALADCADDSTIKCHRRIVAILKSIVPEALKPLRDATICCYSPPPPGCDDDTWNALGQWKLDTIKVIDEIQNTIEHAVNTERTDAGDSAVIHVETLRHKVERGLVEIAKRIRKMNEHESGERTKIAPDNDNLCTANIIAVLADIQANAKAAKVTAERAANNTDAIRADLDEWREYVKNLLDAGGANNANDETPKKKRRKNLATFKPELGFENVKAAIVKVWDDFRRGEADCEMPNGRMRQFRQSRSFGECIDRCGQTIIRGHQTLLDLLTVPESGKKPGEVFEAIVHSSDESKRQKAVKSMTNNKHSAKPPQKKKSK